MFFYKYWLTIESFSNRRNFLKTPVSVAAHGRCSKIVVLRQFLVLVVMSTMVCSVLRDFVFWPTIRAFQTVISERIVSDFIYVVSGVVRSLYVQTDWWLDYPIISYCAWSCDQEWFDRGIGPKKIDVVWCRDYLESIGATGCEIWGRRSDEDFWSVSWTGRTRRIQIVTFWTMGVIGPVLTSTKCMSQFWSFLDDN